MFKKLTLATLLATAFVAPAVMAATTAATVAASTSTQEQLLLKLARDRAALSAARARLDTTTEALLTAQKAASASAALVATDRVQEGQLQEALNSYGVRLAAAQVDLTKAQATLASLLKDLGTQPAVTTEQLARLKARVAEDTLSLTNDAKALIAANEVYNAASARLRSDMTEARQTWLPLLNADQAAVDAAALAQRDAVAALRAAQATYRRDTEAGAASSVLVADRAAVLEAQAQADKASTAVTDAVSKMRSDYAKAEAAIAALPRILADREAVQLAMASRDAVLAQQKTHAMALEADRSLLRAAQARFELAQRVHAAEGEVGPLAAAVRELQAKAAQAKSALELQRAKTAKDSLAVQTAQAAAAQALTTMRAAEAAVKSAVALVTADLAALRAMGYVGSAGPLP